MTVEAVDPGTAGVRSGGTTRSGPVGVLSSAADRVRHMDLRNTWQVAAGAVMMPLGVVVILIAWYGSAHTPYIQQQIPYLVSGSFVGLGLMVLGGLLYWAHWLYRIYDQADLHELERARRDREMIELLAAALSRAGTPVPAPAAAVPAAAPVPPGAPAAAGELVMTASGTNVHRADCAIVARHPEGARVVTAREAAGRPVCRICQPELNG